MHEKRLEERERDKTDKAFSQHSLARGEENQFTNELINAMSICRADPIASASTIGLFLHRRSLILSRSRLANDFQSLTSLWVMQRQRSAGKQSSSFRSGSNWRGTKINNA